MTPVQAAKKTAAPAVPALKNVAAVRPAPQGHWVGDGFPVRTMFHYGEPQGVTPFLLLDYAGPAEFAPSQTRRGVGEHPHRGFETVTIVYGGEVQHRDSAGGGGTIRPGDVQWMTAGSGLVHEEMHSWDFTKQGGLFEAVQLWVNLPARLKMTPPKYQTILNADIPSVPLAKGAGAIRVIAGEYNGARGPANTFTPVTLWDARLNKGAGANLSLPDGHTSLILVMRGVLTVNGSRVRAAELAILERKGEGIALAAEEDSTFLVLSGEPIDEPVFGHGPFVMNTEGEIRQAILDYRNGKMGRLA